MTAIQDVDPATLRRWLEAGEATVVDVRGAAAFAAEHIPGARSMPIAAFDAAALAAAPRPLVFQCEAGVMSVRAAGLALGAGLSDVHHLAGGLRAWKRAGLATGGTGAPGLSIERQVRLVAGALVIAGTALGAVASPWLLLVPALVGAGLVWSGATGWCGMALLLLRLPPNRRRSLGSGA